MSPIPIDLSTALLGGLTPQVFMRRHWQKKPLLVRQAVPTPRSFVGRAELFALAARDDVESRLVVRRAGHWTLRHGPLSRRALPPLAQRDWSLLVQGLDLHLGGARSLLERFRFVPDARLDDVMVSYASDGGGVGPHVDSYDVFLLQIHGVRRWRVGRVERPQLQAGVPLKILTNFVAQDEWRLEPGDMLYLPPGWAHDGVAEGECMTASIGFRAAGRDELARELLQRVLDVDSAGPAQLYRDPRQRASEQPARIPDALRQFGADALRRWLAQHGDIGCALGEVLSEPKPGVWFERRVASVDAASVRLDRCSRMLYDDRHVFINGESFRAAGRDATLMRQLADMRRLDARAVQRLGEAARDLLAQWNEAGWLHVDDEEGGPR